MWKRKRQVNTIALFAGVVTLVSFSFLALFGLSFSMTTDEHGMMSNCPFMSQTEVICPMQVGEHIAKWQQAITGLPQETFELVLVALVAFLCGQLIHRFRQGGTSIDAVRQRLRRELGFSSTFNFLQLAFSQGILHPKIY